ncbi:FAD/NAD(P)-binding protein [Mucilaginibacter auburnensis]|uniref:FAD/NAD(P)-binding protein n=1 Tax=Mucilaginibacter auburnensis TaxID=1457233 RepID=UPI001FE56572|nr:FAD/NAD(P)-binding protein [Mucilaginibacter auburnensis]
MKTQSSNLIAIIGGGPGGLFMYKRLVETGAPGLEVHIYEKNNNLGCGMPYSQDGAADEHITNVSGNEIPQLVTTIQEWIKTVPKDTLDKYNIDPEKFNEYKVLPRLLFGQYLNAQFKLLLKQAREHGINTKVYYNTTVRDVVDKPDQDEVVVVTDKGEERYDRVVVCSGHIWTTTHEGKVKGWFDSPYPPQKIALHANHPVAVRGASLTAIDAIRTLARHNGRFEKDDKGILHFYVNEDSSDFRIAMHTRNGLLPAVRFHLEDSHLGKDTVLSDEEVLANREQNDGFLSLDYVFEKNFKAYIRKNDPEFYQKIANLNMEGFVDLVMTYRENQDPFDLLKEEYVEARESIIRKESVYWKEMLAVLSFAMNYPAKYFSAEDMIRLQKTLMPLISVVIAFVPQSSAETLMALHDAGRLSMITVDQDSEVIPHEDGGAIYKYVDEQGRKHQTHYQLFVDCIGQQHLAFNDIPFRSLVDNHTASHATLRFRNANVGAELMNEGEKPVVKGVDGEYYLIVPGMAINDHFQLLDKFNALNNRIYVMAVPLIGGYNPDYSGLDFSEAASAAIIEAMTGKQLAEAS